MASAIDLAHRRPSAVEPAAVDLAELGVAGAVLIRFEIFQMEQLKGDAGLAPLGVQVGRRRGRADGASAVSGTCTHGPAAPRR